MKSKKRRPKRFSLRQLKTFGVQPTQKSPRADKAMFIQLQGEKSPAYYLGFNNFYVITRYNKSPLYAMAVFELSQKIDKLHKRASASKKAKAGAA